MKIFSWVHRQFHHKVIAKNVDNDKVALLENNEAFDGSWNEGILAIGTFGADLFNNFKEKEDMISLININNALIFDDDLHDDEMDQSPLELIKASKHDHVFHQVVKQNPSPCNDQVDKLVNSSDHQEHVNNSVKIMRSRERITLADLLRADSEENEFTNYELCDDHQVKSGNYTTVNDKNNDNDGTESIKRLLISKAMKKHGTDNTGQPINRTKKLMRKMLRKKIHPDVGIQKLESPSTVCRRN